MANIAVGKNSKLTIDFLTGLMEAHEEMAWMLRSFIEGEAIERVMAYLTDF